MENESDKKLFAGLSEAELDEAEQIEKDVQAAFAEGWSAETASAFVRGAMLIRKKVPDMDVARVVDLALHQGVVAIVAGLYGLGLNRDVSRKPKRTNGKSKLSGAGV